MRTIATIEADQILLIFQQLATNSNSANFNDKINRISKLPKSLTTTLPTFDGKSDKFQQIDDLFRTSLKTHNKPTEEDKINKFHSLMRADALQALKNVTRLTRDNLGEIPTVLSRKYVKPQWMAITINKFHRPVFNPANQKRLIFLDELQKLAKDAFGVAAQAIIEQFIYVNMPPHLMKSIDQAQLESGTYESIVSLLENELELNGLEAPNEVQINTVTQQATQQNQRKPQPTCHHCRKPRHYRNQCRQLKREKVQARNNTFSAGKNNNNGGQTNSNSNNRTPNNTNANITNNRNDREPRPVCSPCDNCGKTNHSADKCYFGANAANRPLPRNRQPEGQNQVQQRNAQNNSDVNVPAAAEATN